jgi:cell wall-associated NlpC family hydrolase
MCPLRAAARTPKPAGRFVAGALTLTLALLWTGHALAASSVPTQGSEGANVLALQAALNDWGQSLPWTAYFGTDTTAAIAAMQRAAGLPPTGALDPATLARLGLTPGGPALHLGSTGADVQALQRALTRAGYPVAPTGLVGPFTAFLVRDFESHNGLRPDGIITLQDVEAVLARTGREGVVITALAQLGDPYAWGGATPGGFDCSGLVTYVFAHDGLNLPHSTYSQWADGAAVGPSALKPGDLVFFTTYAAGPSHVGIYIGDGYFVHAADYQLGVTISSLKNGYYFTRYVGAVNPFQV